jgi:ABC-2 type transport system permease protein
MRLISLTQKSLKENLRDWKILVLTLSFAPFFAIIMYLYLGNPSPRYSVVFVNHDRGIRELRGNVFNGGRILTSHMGAQKDHHGEEVIRVKVEEDLDRARRELADASVDLVINIPSDFSSTLQKHREKSASCPTTLAVYGNFSDPRSAMALAWCDYLVLQFLKEFTEIQEIVKLDIRSSDETRSPSAFELYVPVLLALAIMMLMFTTAATLIKEKDKRTLIRLRLSHMTTLEWLLSVSITQTFIGLTAVATTYGTVLALGFRSEGSLLAVSVIAGLSCLALVGISVILAAWLRTIFDLMTVGCFPFFILMFFSGGMMPGSSLRLFHLGGRPYYINDILPTTHSIAAFKRILLEGRGLTELRFEITAICLLAVISYLTGIIVFRRRHMTPT